MTRNPQEQISPLQIARAARPLLDPRLGDAEDDLASTKSRSLAAIGGRLLAEMSFSRLLLAWLMLIGAPAILLGLAPLVLSGWATTMAGKMTSALAGVGSLLIALLLAALAWFGARPLLRRVEESFWSLNALAVQPVYALVREGLRHWAGRLWPSASPERFGRFYAASAIGAGCLVSALSLILVVLAWPATRWIGVAADLLTPHRLILPAIANSVVVVGFYVMAATLLWGLADATLAKPVDLVSFDDVPPGVRIWRVAHLSDLHVVGERYGFRIESGRTGPRGNERLRRLMQRLDALHAEKPLDLVLVTGDMTDAGRSSEWAEFLDIVAAYPELASRMLMLPGNHDLNVVDRGNPARLELPTSPGKRLRQMRTLSAMADVHGARVHCLDGGGGRIGPTLSDRLARYREEIVTFADRGGLRLSHRLAPVWEDAFPVVLPPDRDDGLGVVLLDSNADAHFSFTNALGMVPVAQERRLAAVMAQFPRAGWIVALHHHLIEYPTPTKAFSERFGTALVNGTWFVRQLRPLADRLVAFHGHRHTDWIGQCGGVRIVSAPSPVMGPAGGERASFWVHTLAVAGGGRIVLAPPEQIQVTLPDEPGPQTADGDPSLYGDLRPSIVRSSTTNRIDATGQ